MRGSCFGKREATAWVSGSDLHVSIPLRGSCFGKKLQILGVLGFWFLISFNPLAGELFWKAFPANPGLPATGFAGKANIFDLFQVEVSIPLRGSCFGKIIITIPKSENVFQSPCGGVVLESDAVIVDATPEQMFQSPCGGVVLERLTVEIAVPKKAKAEFQSPCGGVVLESAHDFYHNVTEPIKVSIPLRGSCFGKFIPTWISC